MKRLQDWYNKPFQFQIKLTIRKSTLLKWAHRTLTAALIIFIFVAKVHAQGIMPVSAQAGSVARTDTPTTNIEGASVTTLFNKGGLSVSDPFITELNHQKLELAKKQAKARESALKMRENKQRAAIKTAQAVHLVSSTPVYHPAVVSGNCGSDPNMAFIYQHESGCSTYAPNAGGCIGLGQACPGSKLYAVCPTLAWACENNFFVSYAISRYGSTYNAKQFWLAHSWW